MLINPQGTTAPGDHLFPNHVVTLNLLYIMFSNNSGIQNLGHIYRDLLHYRDP